MTHSFQNKAQVNALKWKARWSVALLLAIISIQSSKAKDENGIQTSPKSETRCSGSVRPEPYPKTNFAHYSIRERRNLNFARIQCADNETINTKPHAEYEKQQRQETNSQSVNKSEQQANQLSTNAARKLAKEVAETFPKLMRGGKFARAQLASDLKEKIENSGSNIHKGKSLEQEAMPRRIPAAGSGQESKESKHEVKTVSQVIPLASECGSSLFLFAALGLFWTGVAYIRIFGNTNTNKVSKKDNTNFGSKSSSKSTGKQEAQSKSNAEKLNAAQQFMQCALNSAAQAEAAASRACMGNRDLRLAAANEAQCHADSARNWAERATDRTYGASSMAQDTAAKARDAANRAQASADRARYYAATANN